MPTLDEIIGVLVGVGLLVGIPAAIYFVKKKSGLGWSNIFGISFAILMIVKYYYW
jgi:hypothetical protein